LWWLRELLTVSNPNPPYHEVLLYVVLQQRKHSQTKHEMKTMTQDGFTIMSRTKENKTNFFQRRAKWYLGVSKQKPKMECLCVYKAYRQYFSQHLLDFRRNIA
jgi:hypothetical protein